jgi:hypothetical protein
MYIIGRILWWDEAALAESIIRRDFRSLLATPLANLQTAPALYLYAVKIIGVIFGYTETSLRVFSFLAFLGTLVVEGFLLKKAFQLNRVFVFFLIYITATFPVYMYYSNELKPYMSDVFFTLAVLLIYCLYSSGKLRLPIMTVFYCIILLFSSPALFFVASVFIVEFITNMIEKKWKTVGSIVTAGAITLVVFVIYYIFWLMPVAEYPIMV